MLDSSHYALDRDSTSVVDDRATALSDLAIGTRRRRTPFPALPTAFQRALRWWIALRWRLSRSFFSVPLPLLTVEFNIKLGDLIVIIPVVGSLVTASAFQAQDRDVKGCGSAPPISMMLVFLFAIRNNSVLLVATGIPFERVLFYHKLFAFITIILTALYGLAYLLDRADSGRDVHHEQMATGMTAFIGMVAMYILSLNYIRRNFFELFIRLHWVLLLVVVFFAVKHGASLVLVGLIPWVIDMLFRVVYHPYVYANGSLFKKKKTQNVSTLHQKHSRGVMSREQLTISAMPGNITRISFPRVRYDTSESFEYEAGQYAFMCIPRLSLLQWHPFTISSAPHEAMVTFHIKALGDWTTKLHELASSIDLEIAPIDVLVDGPYAVKEHQKFGSFGQCEIEKLSSVLNPDVDEGDNGQEMDEVAPYLPQILLHPRATNNPSRDFYSDIYVTQGHPDLEARGDHRFRTCMRYGIRPDITQILREMGHEALKTRKKRVAVLVCGPPAMVRDIVKAGMKLSREMPVHFDVHSEEFQF